MNALDYSVGDTIQDRYLVLERFSGAMGLAYLVEDRNSEPNLPSTMIMKTLRPEIEGDSFQLQFLNEASIWINIGPLKNVVHAYKVDTIRGAPVVFAEFIKPGILPNVLSEWIHYRLTNLEISLFFIVQLFDGLWYTYQDGVEFHGDLKPSNLLINQDLEVKINDWGFAKAADKEMSAKEFEWFYRYHGPSDYLAPEAKSNNSNLTRALDGYAIGILLGEMLTGERFSAGMSKDIIFDKIKPACFGIKNPMIQILAEAVSGLLCINPAQRVNFYEDYSRTFANLFSAISEINVIDDSDAIIISPMPPGHSDRVKQSESTLKQLRNPNKE